MFFYGQPLPLTFFQKKVSLSERQKEWYIFVIYFTFVSILIIKQLDCCFDSLDFNQTLADKKTITNKVYNQ